MKILNKLHTLKLLALTAAIIAVSPVHSINETGLQNQAKQTYGLIGDKLSAQELSTYAKTLGNQRQIFINNINKTREKNYLQQIILLKKHLANFDDIATRVITVKGNLQAFDIAQVKPAKVTMIQEAMDRFESITGDKRFSNIDLSTPNINFKFKEFSDLVGSYNDVLDEYAGMIQKINPANTYDKTYSVTTYEKQRIKDLS